MSDTTIDLDAIRDRSTIPGNTTWKAEIMNGKHVVFVVTPSGKQWAVAETWDCLMKKGNAAIFIAHAPGDIRALLTHIDDQHRNVEKWRHVVDGIADTLEGIAHEAENNPGYDAAYWLRELIDELGIVTGRATE